MANNTTDRLANTTQPALPLACTFMEPYAWQQEYLTPTTFIIIVVVVCVEVPMCLVTILLNLLVILAVKSRHYLRKQKPRVLLACLAATDLLVGALVLPLVILSHIMRLTGLRPVCLVDSIASDCAYTICGASLFHLVIISGERYVAIKHALRYETLVTTRRLTTAVAAAWAVPVVLTIAVHIEADNNPLLVLGCVLGSVAMIGFFQGAVFLESRRHRKHIRSHQISEAAAREILKKDKAARTTTMIVGALCLCYAPSIVDHGTIFIGENLSLGSMYVVESLLYFNSLVSPVIYCLRTQDFKRAFRELLNLGNPHVDQDLEMNPVGNFAREQMNSRAQVETSQNETTTARLQVTRLRDSRTRSLDFPTNCSQLQRTRRNNSI